VGAAVVENGHGDVGDVSRASRRDKDQGELEHLEARFRERLVGALRACAAGRWGLFGRNDPAVPRPTVRHTARVPPTDAGALLELGEEIDALRSSLGYPDKNALHARLKAYRRLRAENAPGEPRLAQQFLAEIDAQTNGDARVHGAS
jgi:hypothetical protein